MKLMILLRLWAEEEGYKIIPTSYNLIHVGNTMLSLNRDGDEVKATKCNELVEAPGEWMYEVGEFHPADPKFFDKLHSWILC